MGSWYALRSYCSRVEIFRRSLELTAHAPGEKELRIKLTSWPGCLGAQNAVWDGAFQYALAVGVTPRGRLLACVRYVRWQRGEGALESVGTDRT